jgi:UDP-2,4-diacetamido-2,4,6-trideoxy-beta-L-altropyranose hydrolase
MTFVFRADASMEKGTGHIIRCMAIAEALNELGEKSVLVGEVGGIEWLERELAKSVFAGNVIDEKDYVTNYADLLVLDSYTIAPNSRFIQRDNWCARASLVDAETPQYEADAYFNLSPVQTWAPEVIRENFQIFWGIDYMPVRKIHFLDCPTDNRHSKGSELDVLLVGGGTDPTHFVQSLSDIISLIPGSFHIRAFTSQFNIRDERFEVLPIGNKFAENVSTADIVFSTAGMTVWEMLARKKVLAVGLAASNQKDNFEYLTRSQLSIGIGEYLESKWHFDVEAIRNFLLNGNLRDELKKRVDEFSFEGGALNIAKKLIELRESAV